MPQLPNRNTTKHKLDMRLAEHGYGRGYLGMSSLADECSRKLFYGFHFASKKKIYGRTKRIFDVGHGFEAIVLKELNLIGVETYALIDGKKQPLTGIDEEQEELIGFCKHEAGHTDGRGLGFPEYPKEELLLELKTMADLYFQAVKKHGVRESNPVYYGQVQRYMDAKGLKRACFIAINKNNCEYHIEFIDYDKSAAQDLKRKAREIIMSDAPPEKAYIEGYFKCWNCSYKKVCHEGAEPEKNCRTCKFVDIADEGKWLCTNTKHNDQFNVEDEYDLSLEEQKAGCPFYQKGWGL